MRLINTIEINPFDFLETDIQEVPEDRIRFWTECLSNRNLGRLQAIQKDSYLVDITSINDDELIEIIKKHLEEVEMETYEDQVGKLCGGIALIENDQFYIKPNCCGDIGNLTDWEDMLEAPEGEWKQLWIGHPWVYYRPASQVIEISDYTESMEKISLLITISKSDLQRELKKIRLEQENFEKRIQQALEKMGVGESEEIAKLMTRNE
ncbi:MULTISPECIES: hypothetical protein [unclassified Chitinophaga]|uniref:hypothetical protein n=1 Tax=unclassified Chitinophaga TaxID=2619133 RepID=UPI001C6FC901|nr:MULTISPECIES: hypothetical protein [unclassified Chitinophaga]WPV64062.1 hypothetical protein QQL36_19870 [Chitinophaga sp. LS1]